MKVAVYDTYVPKKDGQTMHFDVIVPDGTSPEAAIGFGQAYLKTVGQEGQPCSPKECQFCHTEEAGPEVEQSIRNQGYFILEMEGCPRG